MKTLRLILLLLLSAATGAVFIYSAYTKLYPIRSFEYTMAQYTHMPHMAAAIASRFIIAVEGSLGILIALSFYGRRKWPLRAALALLVIFSAYLVWLWAVAGNDVNCGCFGDTIWMSPSVSLLKNAALILAILVLLRWYGGMPWRWVTVSGITILVCTIAACYIAFPPARPYRIDLAALYADPAFAPPIDLAHGKHIIAFLSPSCIHCRRAALRIHNLMHADHSLPIYMVIGGTTSDLKDFWAASQARDVPYTRLAADPFMKYTHGVFPTILWVDNGTVEADTGYPELELPVIEKWMK